MAEITTDLSYYSIKVKIDGILHLHIQLSEFIGLQSWMDNKKKASIEFTMKNGIIVTEYDDPEKFKAILTQIDKLLP